MGHKINLRNYFLHKLLYTPLARGKINNVFQVCQLVIFAICIITMSACNIYGVSDHKNMYYMDDGYIEINLSMERAMHKYKIKTPSGTVMEIPMHIKNTQSIVCSLT